MAAHAFKCNVHLIEEHERIVSIVRRTGERECGPAIFRSAPETLKATGKEMNHCTITIIDCGVKPDEKAPLITTGCPRGIIRCAVVALLLITIRLKMVLQ